MKASWIAVDWGTTNFRAFLMSDKGDCIDKTYQQKGLLSVAKEHFPATFDSLIAQWTKKEGALPVVMAGMVGSQHGWCDVPYLSAPVGASRLGNHTHKIKLLSGATAHIVPGVKCHNAIAVPEVMRGEEVQLIGLSGLIDGDFNAVLFGTHSKHVCWRNNRIDGFSTVMTGELYSLLMQHSILGKSLPEQVFSHDAFIKGLELSQTMPLNYLLFSARTFKLFSEVSESSISSYISGLLLGHEFMLSDKSKKIYLVGSLSLSKNYEIALNYFGFKYEYFDGDTCFLNGMSKIYNSGEYNE